MIRYQEASKVSSACRVFLSLACAFFVFSCSRSDFGSWQKNASYDYKLFDLLDKYPALHDSIHDEDPTVKPPRADQCDKQQIRLDQCVVNDLLSDTIDEYYQENIKAMAGQYAAIDATQVGLENKHPTHNTVQLLRHLLYRVINQDSLDNGSFDPITKQRSAGASAHAQNLYSFLDDINGKNLDLGKELLEIMRGASKYRSDKFDNALMRKEAEYSGADMDSTPCQTATYNKEKCDHVLAQHNALVRSQNALGKMAMQADYPMCLNSSNKLITQSSGMSSCDKDLGLGHSAQGTEALWMAFFELIKDEGMRNNVYDLIRQVGVFLSGSIPKSAGSAERIRIEDVMETLVRNIESYFTVGGANATGKYATDDNTTYSSAELRNTLKELQPVLARLLMRSDRDASLIYEVNGKKLYVLDEFLKGLKAIGWNPDDARLEESLEDLVKYDQFGRDRTTDPKAQLTSQLESLFFLTSVAMTYGWTDAAKDGVPGEEGKNYGHSHGKPRRGRADTLFNPSPTRSTGSTVNDSLYSMGTNLILGLANQYEMTFSETDQDHLFRSVFPFTIHGVPERKIASKDENKFYYDQNYPISFLVTGAVGAPGSPTGGIAPKDSSGNFILNGYAPFNPVGDNNDTIAVSTTVGMWHVCWNGYGPYYYAPDKANKTPETVQLYGKTWHKYYRANGKLYALVHKPQGARSANWEYIYPPNDAKEPLYPSAFYVAQINTPVTLDAPATVNITINEEQRKVTFPAGQTLDKNTVIALLKDQLQIPFSVTPWGKNKFKIAGSEKAATKIIKIENVSGPNAVELIFNGNGDSILREQPRAEFWNSVSNSDYYLGYFEDSVDGSKYSTLIRNEDGDIEMVPVSDTPGEDEPSGVITEDNISDNEKSRACASPEEAFFRNYQWFFNERKHLLIMPLRMMLAGVLENGIIYIYQEANGFYGFANARAVKGNQVWAKSGAAGQSTVPGDHRMGVVADFDSVATLLMDADAVYNDTLGGGAGFSSILAHNLASLARLGFPSVAKGDLTWTDANGKKQTEKVVDGLVPSYAFDVGSDTWKKRNALVPILMSMFNAIRENTDHTRSGTTGLISFLDTMTALLKPLAYYQKGSGNAPHDSWKYRVMGNGSGDADFLKSGGEFYMSGETFIKPEVWYGSDEERSYFQADKTSTLFSVLIDSNRYPSSGNKTFLDGMIPFLVGVNPDTHQRSELITQAFKLFMNFADDKFADPPGVNLNATSQEFDRGFESWGARRKALYAFEQIATLTKNTQGRLTEITESTSTNKLPDWMFTSGVDSNKDGIPDDMRREEIFGDIDHNSMVGSDDSAKDIKPGEPGYQMGLAYVPDDWKKNPEKLALFRKNFQMLSELLRPKGGDYSVVENIINVMDIFFNQVSPNTDQIKALAHTLGIMATAYNKNSQTWNVASVPLTNGRISYDDHPFDFNDTSRVDDLYRIAGQHAPILNAISLVVDKGVNMSFGNGDGTTTTCNTSNYYHDSAVYLNGLLKTGGLLDYVLEVVDTYDKFGPTQDTNSPNGVKPGIVNELHTFLGENNFTDFNSTLWNDIAKLLAGQVQVLTRNNTPSNGRDHAQHFGFQYNGPSGK